MLGGSIPSGPVWPWPAPELSSYGVRALCGLGGGLATFERGCLWIWKIVTV